jgi:hypothetical protein
MMAKSVEDALRWLAPAGASTADDMSAFWNFVEASSVDQVG